MKILDRYILVTFLKTFFSVFIIFMFIFILQGVWLYISELAGKDLDAVITLKFIIYYMPKLIPLVVPLTILLASIMVFGNFAENYEFAAMKSTGISLQRAMRSLSVFIVALGIGCFFFANNVIPWGEFEFYNLRKNIAKVKPAMAIVEGQFNEIGNINIKVAKKSGEEGKYLDDVIIHQKTNIRNGNYKVIASKKGELKSSKDSNILQLELINGNYYEEVLSKDAKKNLSKPHVKSYFDSYTINVDLEKLNTNDFDDKSHTDRYNMLAINELNYTIDSLKTQKKEKYDILGKTLYNRSTYEALNILPTTTVKPDSSYVGNVLDLYSNSKKVQIVRGALTSANSAQQVLTANVKSIEKQDINLNKHIIALHDKYALAISCIVLFFVGAPLGALIRKGGLGLPIVIAVLLFLTYHFLGIFAKNSAEKGSFNPVLGAWASTLIMLPLSIYLTRRATNDKGVISFDAIVVPIKKLFKAKNDYELSESETKTYNYYKKYNEDELVAIVKNEADNKSANIALRNLLNRNIALQTLKEKGLNIPQNLILAKTALKDYKDYAKTCLVSYSIGAALLILHFVFANNKLPELAEASLSLSIIAFIFLAIYTVVSIWHYNKFYKLLGKSNKRIHPILHIVLLPIYPLKHIVVNNKVNEHFYQACLNTIK